MSLEIITQPRLFVGEINPLADEMEQASQRRLISLQDAIERRPRTYQQTFERLGALATADSLDISDSGITTRNADLSVEGRIREYFVKRDDMETDFDPATEAAIDRSTEIINLRKRVASLQSQSVKKTGTQRETRVNPNAIAARDEARRKTFQIYLDRVVQYHDLREITRIHHSA